MDKMKIEDRFGALLDPNPNPNRFACDFTKPEGKYHVEVIRNGVVVHREEIKNVVANEGKNLLLNVGFGATAKPTWYMGLLDSAGGTTTSSANTMSSHSGWTEFTAYSAGTRPTWGAGTAASQAITNSTAVSFAITGSGAVVGGFITSDNTKGGTSGVLWSVGTLSSINVVNGDTLRLTYTLTLV